MGGGTDALYRPEDARKLVKAAMVGEPNFTVSRFLFQERCRDPPLLEQLRRCLEDAGLPP